MNCHMHLQLGMLSYLTVLRYVIALNPLAGEGCIFFPRIEIKIITEILTAPLRTALTQHMCEVIENPAGEIDWT